MMTQKDQNLIWIDCEMTGLSPEDNCLIEIATVVTDSDLNILAEGPVFAIHQDDTQLAKMDAWNVKQHNESGLIARVKASQITVAIAESKTLNFLSQHVPVGKSPMCGNSVCLDKRFLARYMPQLVNYFHYRQIDVSTIKELAARWAPNVYQQVRKSSTHLALADIKESIAELRFYREELFK